MGSSWSIPTPSPPRRRPCIGKSRASPSNQFARSSIPIWAQLQVRGLVQAEQSIKASVDPSEPKVQEMVETVLTPPHPDPFEALLNEPFTRTLDHATTQR